MGGVNVTECGLTNLATCLPEKIFEYLVQMLNQPVQPLLDAINYLLTQPVNINVFHSFWAIIVYILSMFYGLFFLFAGFQLMISGYDARKRENAKEWLRNVVLMILFVQASFLLYDLIIQVASLLTAGIMDIIDPNFFLMTMDNIVNFGLQISLLLPYVLVLIITVILLALRYLLVSIGVVLFPFALFFYFIPPLQSYGKMILNILLVCIFVTFFDAIFLFGASMLLDVGIFSNLKIILATVGFMGINIMMILLVAFAVIKAVFSVKNSSLYGGMKSGVQYIKDQKNA